MEMVRKNTQDGGRVLVKLWRHEMARSFQELPIQDRSLVTTEGRTQVMEAGVERERETPRQGGP